MSAHEKAKAELLLASLALGQAQQQFENAKWNFRQALNAVDFTKDEERRTTVVTSQDKQP